MLEWIPRTQTDSFFFFSKPSCCMNQLKSLNETDRWQQENKTEKLDNHTKQDNAPSSDNNKDYDLITGSFNKDIMTMRFSLKIRKIEMLIAV